MAYMERFDLRTEYNGMHDITAQVQEIVRKSGVKDGICIVHCNHTTAGIIVTSFWDKRGHVDFMIEMDRVFPTRNDFLHQFDTPTDAAGHIKSALAGVAVTLIVSDSRAMLGSSQGILFAEFDGPRDRQVYVKVVPD
ncbi:MAG: secondary thiamine-phosphate synthase enzyme YjbQ [Oscillospiraceae bacterium]|nr:secondary thiamine-phosphate synthase enzyme YjbQ [Oscillospiraceae bacterium]